MKPNTLQFGLLTLSLVLPWACLRAAADPIILDPIGIENLQLKTVEVETQAFETTLFAIGRIEEIPARHSVISSRVAGRVSALKVFEGDAVQAGDLIATVETRRLGDPPPSIQLKAPQAGLVITSHLRLGQPVQPDVELMDLSDRSQMWAVAKIPEQEASQVKIGSRARIRVPALGGQDFEATLVRFGVNADRVAGAVEGIFIMDNSDGQLRPGMRAEFSVVLEQRADVLAAPREAIQGDPANRIVFVKDFDLPNAFLRVPVVTGQRNDHFVEIISGLFPGDEVVTQGSYALGFVNPSAGLSLKDALDAAHGHEHNEDGSEVGDSPPEDHKDHDDHGSSRWLLLYSGLITAVALTLLLRLKQRNDTQA